MSTNFFDFRDADTQREFSGEPIPGGTIALFRMSIRRPKPELAAQHPLVTRSKTSAFQYLDCEFEITSGSLKGRKMWQNMGVGGDGSDGHNKAVAITRATLKAMLQATHGIMPTDTENPKLIINGFEALDGLVAPIKVGYEKPEAGRAVKNCIRAIITPDKQEYASVMAGGEVLGSEPVPATTGPAASTPPASGGWGATPPPAAAPASGPSWAGTSPASPAPVPPPTQTGLPGASAPAWAR